MISILSGMTQPIDRLAKHIRSGAKVAPGIQKDIDSVIRSTKRTLMRTVNDVNSNGSGRIAMPDASRQACRHLLKLYLALLAQVATSTLSADVARVIMRTTKALYLIDIAPCTHSKGHHRATHDGGSDESHDRPRQGQVECRSESGRAGRGKGKGGAIGEEQMLQGGGDLLLELLQHFR